MFSPDESKLSLLYRGFFPCFTQEGKEKIPCVKSICEEECKSLAELSYAVNIDGYLKAGIVMVDFDDKHDVLAFEKILRHLNIKVPTLTTTKGKHFYFLENNLNQKALTRVMLACGLKADFKLGSKRGLDCIKFHGEFREWTNLDAPLMSLPDWCKPLNEAPSKSGESLASLQEGSRNDTLFKFNGRLERSGFERARAQYIIRDIINPCVLSNPLTEEEVYSVTRDELYNNNFIPTNHRRSNSGIPPLADFYEGKTLRQDLLAEFLINRWHVVDIGSSTYYFKDGVYTPLNERIFGKMIVALYPPLTDNKRKEVFKQLVCMAPSYPMEEPDKYLNYIAFNNGILNIDTGEFVDNSPELLILNKIPHDYNPDAKSELLDKFIASFACNDQDIITTLYELSGHCLYRKNTIRGLFIFVGKKRNGKSTFLDMLQYALGESNVSLLKMQELSDRFKTAELHNKLANIGDDIPDDYIPDTNKLKSAATSNPLVVERKWGDPFSIVPYATLIFSANDLPRLKDNTGAMMDRITLIPCNAFFDPSTPGYDPELGSKLKTKEVAEALLAKAVMGLKRLLITKKLTKGYSSEELTKEYQEYNNPILGFLRDDSNGLGGELAMLEHQSIDEIYARFAVFCAGEGIALVRKDNFARKVKAVVGNCTTIRRSTRYGRFRYFAKINSAIGFYIQV